MRRNLDLFSTSSLLPISRRQRLQCERTKPCFVSTSQAETTHGCVPVSSPHLRRSNTGSVRPTQLAYYRIDSTSSRIQNDRLVDVSASNGAKATILRRLEPGRQTRAAPFPLSSRTVRTTFSSGRQIEGTLSAQLPSSIVHPLPASRDLARSDPFLAEVLTFL